MSEEEEGGGGGGGVGDEEGKEMVMEVVGKEVVEEGK